MKRLIIILVLVLLIFCQSVVASDDVEQYITDEMEKNLPEDIINEDDYIDYNVISDFIIKNLREVMPSVFRNLMSVLSVIIITALFSVFSSSLKSSGIRKCFSYLSSACIALVLYSILDSVWNTMNETLTDIHSFMMTLTPTTTLLYSLGGNITTAAVNNTAMGIILSVFETICYHGVRPMLQICFGFSVVSALSVSIELKPLVSFIRKTYTTVLVFVMSSMICILSLQNMLTQPKDSLGIRTVKFAAANSIPLVGGALGEAAATVGTGVVAIRGTFGVLAIIAILIMVIPGILSIWLNKISFSIGGAICSVFGSGKEAELVSGASELLNFALAIIVSSVVMFIISISIFAGAGSAIG